MSVHKNEKNGTWYVMVRYTDWQGNYKQKCKRGFATRRDAQEWEKQFLLQKRADVNMTLESFYALYEEDLKPRVKLTTWKTKENIIRTKILPFLGKKKLSEINTRDVVNWQNEIIRMKDMKGNPIARRIRKQFMRS